MRPSTSFALVCSALLACSVTPTEAGLPVSAEPPPTVAETPPSSPDASTPDAGVDADLPRTPCAGPVSKTTGIAYAPTHEKNRLDLYVPSTGDRCPLIIWIHGGGWQSGSKELQAGAVSRLLRQTERGYAVASIGYRLSGDATFPAQIHDVKAAVRFLRANASALRLDPRRFATWGTSAGGHLAALLGTSAGVAALEDAAQGNGSVSSAVQAVIDCYGPTDLQRMDSALKANGCGGGHDEPDSPESKMLGCTTRGLVDCPAAKAANPITYADASDPPTLIGHGLADCTVPHQQSQLLHDALLAAGVTSSLRLKEGGSHAIASCPDDGAIDSFLDTVLQ